ncbi:hypothetical protein EMPG_09425, partial [Blastomyces silverae]
GRRRRRRRRGGKTRQQLHSRISKSINKTKEDRVSELTAEGKEGEATNTSLVLFRVPSPPPPVLFCSLLLSVSSSYHSIQRSHFAHLT